MGDSLEFDHVICIVQRQVCQLQFSDDPIKNPHASSEITPNIKEIIEQKYQNPRYARI